MFRGFLSKAIAHGVVDSFGDSTPTYPGVQT